jgi:hypothetical protein
MNNSPSVLNSIKPEIRNLNVRTISKMIASKIITTTELQLQREPNFVKFLMLHNISQPTKLLHILLIINFLKNMVFSNYL